MTTLKNKHLSVEDRCTIQEFLDYGYSFSRIEARLHKNRTIIAKEVLPKGTSCRFAPRGLHRSRQSYQFCAYKHCWKLTCSTICLRVPSAGQRAERFCSVYEYRQNSSKEGFSPKSNLHFEAHSH